MIAPMKWLKEYAPTGLDTDVLLARMERQGIAVETIARRADEIKNVVVGRVDSITKHENADTLWICQVDVGTGTVQIVTGAQNVTQGALVPVALDGSTLPEGKKIKTGKLRGALSQGMLCSGTELGLTEAVYPGANAEGILLFREAYALGSDVRAIFDLDGDVVDFDILPNRPDCQCMLGLARESAVAAGVEFRMPEIAVEENGPGRIEDYIRISVREPDLCPRYMARVVKNVRIAPSPLWLRNRLYQAGVRPVNNIVDITNYVMLEFGHPMHAFDLRTVRKNEIIVRCAAPGEALTTLDGKERALTDSMLVIADGEGATGLAGIMGGLNSEIEPDTTDILFECAVFAKERSRQTARALGLRTESSSRFEKGVSCLTAPDALERAAQLVRLLDAGDVVPGVIDVQANAAQAQTLQMPVEHVKKLTGVDVPRDEMLRILRALSFDVREAGDILHIGVPAFRQDIEGKADIVEEVLRVYGYEHIGSETIHGVILGENSRLQKRNRRVETLLTGAGYSGIATYSFLSKQALEKLGLPEDAALRRAARLLNPLSEDYAYMRTTLVPSMLTVLANNVHNGTRELSLYELAVRYLPEKLPMETIPPMPQTVCIGRTGGNASFFTLKGVVERLLGAFGLSDARFVADGAVYLHPGRKARIVLGDRELGYMGEIHPSVCEAYELPQKAYIAELNLDEIYAAEKPLGDALPPPRYPEVLRDLAIVVEEGVTLGACMDALSSAGAPLLASAELFDIYRGVPIEAGKKSMAFSLRFRHAERTLTDEEIARCMERILQRLTEQVGAVLR